MCVVVLVEIIAFYTYIKGSQPLNEEPSSASKDESTPTLLEYFFVISLYGCPENIYSTRKESRSTLFI